jgi:peptidylamidoglycolate lyase
MNQHRREFLLSLSSAILGFGATGLAQSQKSDAGAEVLGQGNFRWRVVPGWGVLDAETPVAECHGMLQTKDGRIFLLTTHLKNNVIIYDRTGKLLGKWGTEFPGAHGFTLLEENGQEFFLITDHTRNQFFTTTLDGKTLRIWGAPEKSGKYRNGAEFRPTHGALSPDGGLFVVDGYGKNWCHRYDSRGEYMNSFGGDQPGGAHLKCAHGAWVDTRDSRNLIWITSREEGKIKRYTLEGVLVDILDLPGALPNFIVPFGDHTVIPCLQGNEGHKELPDNGLLCILGPDGKIVSNLAATAPVYVNGQLAPLGCDTKVFTYPHGILIDDEQSIYVAQYNSGKTYPIKLERVKA